MAAAEIVQHLQRQALLQLPFPIPPMHFSATAIGTFDVAAADTAAAASCADVAASSSRAAVYNRMLASIYLSGWRAHDALGAGYA